MSTLALVIAVLLIPFIVLIWATESTPQRAQRLRRKGWTQTRIAKHLGISLYRVRLAIA